MTCVASGSPPSRPWRTRSSIAARKAARVLPDPVGAAMRVWRPALIKGQASACAGVGAAKLSANQPATAGWNRVSASAGRDAAEGLPALARAGGTAARSACALIGPRETLKRPYMAPHRVLVTPPQARLPNAATWAKAAGLRQLRESAHDRSDPTDRRPQRRRGHAAIRAWGLPDAAG